MARTLIDCCFLQILILAVAFDWEHEETLHNLLILHAELLFPGLLSFLQ